MYKLSSSSSSSSDEDNGNFGRTPKLYRESNNYFELYEDDQFFVNFRLSKKVVKFVLNEIEHLIKVHYQRGGSIKPMHQLLLTLRFYALGNILKTISDFIGVSRPAACRIISNVSHALFLLKAKYIKLPKTELEMEQVAQNFLRISQVSKVIGSINYTYIRTKFPAIVDEERFKCKHGYSALKVQGICDAHMKFIDLGALWPGSTADQTIFNSCNLKSEFDSGKYCQYNLVGNSSFKSKKYVLVEQEGQIEGESAFKKGLNEIRNLVEKTFTEWKKRFPILSSGLCLDMETALYVINATAILHNIAKEMKDNLPANWNVGVVLDASQIRQKVIEQFCKSK